METNIVREIKSKRLKWTGHERRVPDSRSVKLALEEAPVGKRPLGRLRLLWKDNIAKELRAVNIDKPLDAILDILQSRIMVKLAPRVENHVVSMYLGRYNVCRHILVITRISGLLS